MTTLTEQSTESVDFVSDNTVTDLQTSARVFYKFTTSSPELDISVIHATVRVVNDAKLDQRLILAPYPPTLTSTKPKELFICSYATTEGVPPTGFANMILASSSTTDFNIKSHPSTLMPIYAVTGTTNEPIKTDTVLNVSFQHLLTKESSSCTMEMKADEEPRFKDFGRSPREDRFRIMVDDSFTFPNKRVPFIGLGVPDPYHPKEAICVVAWEAVPKETYLILPSNLWRCSRGKSKAGHVISTDISADGHDVEFYESGATYRFKCTNTGTIVPN